MLDRFRQGGGLTPPSNTGAIPLAKLAEVESDMHHVREQADIDRRQQAQRWIDLRAWQDKTTDAIDSLRDHMAGLRGGIAVCKWLIGLVGLSEAARFILDVHR